MFSYRLITLIILMSLNFSARAGLFEIPVEGRDYGSLPADLHDEADLLFDSLETEVNEKFPNVPSAGRYLKNIANSAVVAGTGNGVDYSAPFDIFLIGAQVGIGAELGDTKLSKVMDDPQRTGGFAPTAGLMLGLNWKVFKPGRLWFVELSRLKTFVHYFSRDFKSDDFSIGSRSMGIHFQYKAIEERKWASWLKWNGVDFTAGYRFNRVTGNLSVVGINESTTRDISGFGETTLNFTGSADLNLVSRVHSLPLEASTSARIFWSLFSYAGLAGDLSFGKTEGTGVLNNANVSASGAVGSISATPRLNLSESKGPTPISVRYFAGLGVEMGVASIYAQWHHAPFTKTLGVAAGVKAFW